MVLRSHREIIDQMGGPRSTAVAIGLPENRVYMVRSWRSRSRIPSRFWDRLITIKAATPEELIKGAADEALPPLARAS